MSRHDPPRARSIVFIAALILIAVAGAAHADEPAVEDRWWQVDGRDRSAYLEAGIEVTVDDGNVAGEMGEAGNVELTTGFWWVPYIAAELQLSVGQAVNPGVLSDTEVSSTLGGIGAGLRLGLPIRVSPVLAAHIGYRQVLSESAVLTCGADCANRQPMAVDHAPDQQVYGDAEAGLQINLGVFSMTATVEYSRLFNAGAEVEVLARANPDAPGAAPAGRTRADAGEVGLNLQAGVRF